MSKTQSIKIMIVDDHPVVREGLSRIIVSESGMEVIAEAETGAEALKQYRKLRPDIVLLDMRMPEMTGIQTIEAIRKEFSNARIIVLSTYDLEEDIYLSLQAGARGYILKDSPRNELLASIRRVHAGERVIPPTIATRLAERIGGNELTAREFEVLKLIVNGKSNKQIGDDLGISEGTVKSHVNNILDKLGVTDRTQAVSVALKRGIVHLE
ncbi:response regulator transcription factor [bacterium]|nr:response regulator transcription factor [bacterium]MCI0615640.1 response regulator transcription factor [bacterium]